MDCENKKIVHISDDHYIGPIKENAILLCWGTPEELIVDIEQNYFKASMFVINVNYKYKERQVYRYQNPGIEVLKLLRLKNYRQHCILYSFFPRDYFVEKNPKNIILYSSGVSFIQLPQNFSKWDEKFFENKAKFKAPEDISAYYRAESKLPDNHHFFANWWGVWQLWQIQRAVENLAGDEEADKIAQNFGKAYKEMNSYQGLLSR